MEYITCYHCGQHVHKPMDAPLSVEETMSRIEDAVCDYYGVTIGQVKGGTKPGHIVSARQMIMYLVRLTTKMPLQFIGDTYGKDHATVLHSCKMVMNYMDTEPHTLDYVRSIISYLALTPHDTRWIHPELFKGIISKKASKVVNLHN